MPMEQVSVIHTLDSLWNNFNVALAHICPNMNLSLPIWGPSFSAKHMQQTQSLFFTPIDLRPEGHDKIN